MTNDVKNFDEPDHNGDARQDKNVPISMPVAGIELLGKTTGFIVGSRVDALMRLETDKNLIVMGSIGSGKGRSVIIPNLLTHNGSILSVEIGGASYKETRNFREHVLGQKVFLLDPLRATGEKSNCFNVLDIQAFK